MSETTINTKLHFSEEGIFSTMIIIIGISEIGPKFGRRLFAFDFKLMPLEKAWIHLFTYPGMGKY